jgi:two-component system, NarL family, sensor kinase
MKNKLLLIVFIFLLPVLAGTQPLSVNDSLKQNIVRFPKEDSFRVKAILNYIKAKSADQSTELLPYIEEMLRISKQIKYEFGIRKGHLAAVLFYGDRGDFRNSFLHADTLAARLKHDQSQAGENELAYLNLNLGNNYLKSGDYLKAVSLYISAALLFEKLNNKIFAANTYLNISNVYELLNQPQKSAFYTQMAATAAEGTGNERLLCAVQLATIADLLNTNEFKKAEALLLKTEPMVERVNSSYTNQNYFYHKGKINRALNRKQEAFQSFHQSLQYARENEDVFQVVDVMTALFQTYLTDNDLPSAKKYIDSVLALAEANQLNMSRLRAFEGLASWYEKKEDAIQSKRFSQLAAVLNDSLLSVDKKNQLVNLETQFQVQAKENEIKVLRAEQKLVQMSLRQKSIGNYILSGGLVFLLLLSVLSYRTYRQKQRIQQQQITELEKEKQLLATEAVLKGQEDERTRLAKDLHDGLGGMLSGIKYSFTTIKGNLLLSPDNTLAFERSMDMLDSSIKELRMVAHNLMPESLVKFGLDAALKDFCSSITGSGVLQVNYHSFGMDHLKLDQNIEITLYRIIQELVNNSIKHAAANESIVQLQYENNLLTATVEDNGKGFDISCLDVAKARPDGPVGRGIGWNNIHNRVDYLKGKVNLVSEKGKGTSVSIELNL